MSKYNKRLKLCVRIMLIVILLIFSKFPAFSEPLTMHETNLTGNEMKRYSDLEVETLIEEVSQAAYEAIEQAATEAARAAAIDALEREAALARQTQNWKSEAEKKAEEVKAAKKAGRKNTLIGVLIGFVGGLAIGIGGTLIMGSR